MQPGDVPITYADTSALERDFGYKPNTSLREGLRKLQSGIKKERAKMKLAIDLLWVRPKQVGGIESYIRNLLDGLLLLPNQEIEYWLIVSTDNEKNFF